MRLSQQFFQIALVVVLGIVVAYGGWAGQYVSDSIVRGVGSTAAGSIVSLISRDLEGILNDGTASPEDRRAIEAAFDIASETSDTRLLMLQVRRPDGTQVLRAGNPLEDTEASAADVSAAAQGQLVLRFVDVIVPGIGPLPPARLPVLKIYTPLGGTGAEVRGVAELYFGAKTIRRLQAQATSDSWIIAALLGFLALGAVALLVDVTGSIISDQRRKLAENLRRSQHLLRENMQLQSVSDALRMDAMLANERVLVEVGSDIHDGPLQLLTLLILQLPADGAGAGQSSRRIAQDAMRQLRGISAGLVLPELSDLTLSGVIELAIERHEDLTGAEIARDVAVDGDLMGPLSARICAFRVVQEALTNANRHGLSNVARVLAHEKGGWLDLVITNPLPPDAVQPQASDRLGLRAMRLRVESQGGQLEVSFAGGEARNAARIPLTELPHASSPVTSSGP
ncbi:sensor histidine kinase [Devosia sp.]|uniref:sensor histidine kinase n=1 Tax=Devosia sp. TaxID=1871048 RepID=UPI003A8D79CC